MKTQQLIDYEEGHLNDFQVVELFQDLIDSGLVWELQGHYGRTAAALLNSGDCLLPGQNQVELDDADPSTLITLGPTPLIEDDDDVYAMHGIDDGPVPLDEIYDESGIVVGNTSRGLAEEKHVGAIWGQEPE